MWKLNALWLLVILVFLGCSKEHEVVGQVADSECIDAMLSRHGLVPYDGQPLDCRWFLGMYRYRSRVYFSLGNHCADIIENYMDCQGMAICTQETSRRECRDFRVKRVYVGIVGMQPD